MHVSFPNPCITSLKSAFVRHASRLRGTLVGSHLVHDPARAAGVGKFVLLMVIGGIIVSILDV